MFLGPEESKTALANESVTCS